MRHPLKSALALTLAIAVMIPTLAQTVNAATPVTGKLTAFKPIKFKVKDRGLPGRREGGGTRGGACETNDRPLMALMPKGNVGLTMSAYPTFSWSMPTTKPTTAVFVLKKTDAGVTREVYSTEFQVSGQPGLVSLSLPHQATLPPLEVGQQYSWGFAIVCNADEPSGNMLTEGWVQRVAPSSAFKAKLAATPSALEQARLYAEEGYWHDATTHLLELRRAQPNDRALAQTWTSFLESVSLLPLANDPLLPPAVVSTQLQR